MNRRLHQTTAAMKGGNSPTSEYDFNPGDRVLTADGLPGQIASVKDGPIQGMEEYEVVLDNGLGGGSYSIAQLQRESTPVESSRVTAAEDYPELAEIIHERPDPSRMEYTASLRDRDTLKHGYDDATEYKEDVATGFDKNAIRAFTTAAVDESFRFHFTAAWKDVVAKAKRIRSSGGVQITHAADGIIYGNVNGDHHVYETGIERLPNSRTAVSGWSCGCKWGAYHWGAEDDLSRFAGRQCSHSLALQFEAQSRGMFGKEVYEDVSKPKWVPNRVVVKYDIDDDKHIKSTSSLSLSPASVLSSLVESRGNADLIDRIHTIASVYDPFGDTPTPMKDLTPNVPGATEPHDPGVNPGSAGFATGADPANWGSIQDNDTFSRMSSLEKNQAYNDLIESMRQRFANSLTFEDGEEGAEAELKDEPEAALPEATARNMDFELGDALNPDRGNSQPSGADSEGLQTGDPNNNPNPLPQEDSITHRDEIDEIVRRFHSRASKLGAKTALKDFSFQEQQMLINEGRGARARNFDRLDIKDTHYAYLDEEEEDDNSWLM